MPPFHPSASGPSHEAGAHVPRVAGGRPPRVRVPGHTGHTAGLSTTQSEPSPGQAKVHLSVSHRTQISVVPPNSFRQES